MIQAKALIAKFQYGLDHNFGYIYGNLYELWSKAKQAAYVREYSGDSQRQASCEYGGKWDGHYVTDCSGFFTWAFKELGGTMYHGSNTMYRSWCTSKGKITSATALLPGYAVFTGNENTHNHVGLYIGDGWVIEAANARDGVIKSKVSAKKWTYWGALKGVDYSDSSESHAPAGSPTLRKGDKGEAVAEMQGLLAGLGYDLGKYGIDGDFGSATEKAVRAFQKASGLTVDGVVGKDTWNALRGHSGPNRGYSIKVTGLTKEEAEKLNDMLAANGRTVTIIKGE